MANLQLYDIGSVSDETYLYKGAYRVDTSLNPLDRYEIIIIRLNIKLKFFIFSVIYMLYNNKLNPILHTIY